MGIITCSDTKKQYAGSGSSGWFVRTDYEYISQNKSDKTFKIEVYQVLIINNWRINFSASKDTFVEIKYKHNGGSTKSKKKSGTYSKGLSTTSKTVRTFSAVFELPYDDDGTIPNGMYIRSGIGIEVQELGTGVWRSEMVSKWGNGDGFSNHIPKLVVAPNVSISSVTSYLDTIKISWNSSLSISSGNLQYSTNNGSNWKNMSGSGKSGSATVNLTSTGSKITPNTKYTIKVRAKTTSWGTSGSKSTTTKNKGLINTGASFNIGDNLSFTKSNPSGNRNKITLQVGGVNVFTQDNVSSNSLSLNISTDAIVDSIYSKLPLSGNVNTISTKLILETFGTNGTYSDNKTGTATLRGNVKTSRAALPGSTTPKRAKVWVGNSSGKPVRAVCWIGVNNSPRRSK